MLKTIELLATQVPSYPAAGPWAPPACLRHRVAIDSGVHEL
jgi:hypothetical protein